MSWAQEWDFTFFEEVGMDDEPEDVEWEEGSYTPMHRATKADLLVLGVGLLSRLACAVSDTLQMAEAIAAGHANYLTNRTVFHEQATLEIESLVAGDEDD